jgi:hypothetical protein
MKSIPVSPAQIDQAHALYCQLTGQTLSLGFERQRLWFDLLRLGYGPEQIRRVIVYLQQEIRAARRNVGALKLSNLLQPDRFEEDLQISQVKLKITSPKQVSPPPPSLLPLDTKVQEQGRQRALKCIQKLKADLQINSDPRINLLTSPQQCEEKPQISTDQSTEKSTD